MATDYTALKPQEVNAYDLASLYLTQNNLPNTSKNRTALASWFMAESAHGSKPGTIIMYNNNPLNITTGSNALIYHQFPNNNLKFASYPGTSSGAQEWYKLLQSNPQYKGIITALQNQDQVGLASAVGRSPWGTSTQGILNVMRSQGTDLTTGANLGDGTIQGSGNGSNLNSFQLGLNKWLQLSGIDPKSALTQTQYNTFLDWYAKQSGIDISGDSNIQSLGATHVGKPWTQLSTDAATMQGDKGDPLASIGNALGTIAGLFDPAKGPQRWLHIGAIAAGAGMIFAGMMIMIKGAATPSLNAGDGGDNVNAGDGGGNVTVIENFGEDEEEAVEEEVAPSEKIAAAAPKPRRASTRRPKTADWSQYDLSNEEKE